MMKRMEEMMIQIPKNQEVYPLIEHHQKKLLIKLYLNSKTLKKKRLLQEIQIHSKK